MHLGVFKHWQQQEQDICIKNKDLWFSVGEMRLSSYKKEKEKKKEGKKKVKKGVWGGKIGTR